MKKRILSALMAIMLCIVSIGTVSVSAKTGDLILSDTTTVNVENTDTIFAKATDDEKNSGSYSLYFKSGADHLEASQRLLENAVVGETYMLSAYVKPVSGQLWFRLGWDNDAWMAADSSLGTDWVKVEKEVTVAGNEGDLNTILIHNSGVTEFYIDDLSLVKVGETEELVPDGGFEEVTADIPDEDLILSETTTVNVENTDAVFAKVTDDEKNSGNYSLHFKTGGDWLEVSQRLLENAVVGETYMLSAYVKPVTGRIWFRLGWDNDAWMAADSSLGTDWVKVEKEVTVAGNEGDLNTILFHSDGATEFYLDDVSLVKVGETEELVPDGGFEEVRIDIPDEDLILSDTTTVNVENTDTIFARATENEKHCGSYSLHFKSGTNHLEASQKLLENAVVGETYMLSAYVKPVSGQLWFRLGWDNDAWMAADSSLGTDWVKVEKEVTVAGNEGDLNTILIHNSGVTEFYIDDLSLVKVGETTELVPDGGFEEVRIDIPDEDLILSNTTTVNVKNTDTIFARATDNEKNSGNYSLHFKTGGDWLEVSQRLLKNAVVGETYMLSAYVKPVTGRIWFRLGWDNDAWMAADSSLGTDWVKVEKEVTVAGNEGDLNTILFHSDGATEFYLDDVSLVKVGETDELVPDGGFEEVTGAGIEHVHVWDEGVITVEPTVDAEGVKTYTCTGCGETKTEAIDKLAPTYVPGDTDGNGLVETRDIILVRRHIAGGYNVEISTDAADVDKNGLIETRDIILVRRFIAGGYGVELK